MKFILLFALTALLCSGEAQAQKKTTKKGKKSEVVKADTTAVALKKARPGSIEAVISPKAPRMNGMFTAVMQDGKYFYIIPQSMLGRDMLIVNRLSKGPADLRAGNYGYAGDQINNAMIRFERSPDGKRVYIKKIQTKELPRTTSGDMYEAVMRSNIQPVVTTFDIKGQSVKRDSILIEVTDFLNGDNELVSFGSSVKDAFKATALQKESSYIYSIKAFPTNIEVKTVKTFMMASTKAPATFELNSSLLLLPEVPMQPRYADARVGYFAESYIDYDQNPQGVKTVSMITRWRLEPKPEDVEKYKQGELVEPAKPIIYYIDPTTPKKWVPYLIQGVNDWEPVFRKAGFKNAIMALEAPVNDPTWSLEDARHSAIIYKPSNVPNASGPHNRDPRSGEILESHINWYHNVMYLLRNWYMLQAGPNDPRARQMEFSDELMGELIRFVSSHEVGHTLGLRHNFGATSTVPVDSLRSRTYLQKYGHTPSIMDYSRFNYVVQPEDGIEPGLQYPRINDYDEWAIEWGYTRFPDLKTPQSEATKLNQWIIEKQKNPRLWFGHEMNQNDPRSQAEDLGDNQMKANSLGIKNLKRVMEGLPKWTEGENQGYSALRDMHKEVLNQYSRYTNHVIKWIGGIYENPMSQEQGTKVYSFVEKAKQKEAMAYLEKEVFTTPKWLLDPNILEKTGDNGLGIVNNIYAGALSGLLNTRVLTNLINAEAALGNKAYTQTDLYNDLNRIIFGGGTPDAYKRALQKTYVTGLITRSGLLPAPAPAPGAPAAGTTIASDIQSYAVYQLRQLQSRLSGMSSGDPVVAAHYQFMAKQIGDLLKK